MKKIINILNKYFEFIKNNKKNLINIKLVVLLIINIWLLGLIYCKIINVEDANIVNNSPIILKMSELFTPLLQELGLEVLSTNTIKWLIIMLVIMVTNLTVLYFSQMLGMIMLGIFGRYSYKSYHAYLLDQEKLYYMGFEKINNNIEHLVLEKVKENMYSIKEELSQAQVQPEVIPEVLSEVLIQPEVIDTVVNTGINWWVVGACAAGAVVAGVITWYLISKYGGDLGNWWKGTGNVPNTEVAGNVANTELAGNVVNPELVALNNKVDNLNNNLGEIILRNDLQIKSQIENMGKEISKELSGFETYISKVNEKVLEQTDQKLIKLLDVAHKDIVKVTDKVREEMSKNITNVQKQNNELISDLSKSTNTKVLNISNEINEIKTNISEVTNTKIEIMKHRLVKTEDTIVQIVYNLTDTKTLEFTEDTSKLANIVKESISELIQTSSTLETAKVGLDCIWDSVKNIDYKSEALEEFNTKYQKK